MLTSLRQKISKLGVVVKKFLPSRRNALVSTVLFVSLVLSFWVFSTDVIFAQTLPTAADVLDWIAQSVSTLMLVVADGMIDLTIWSLRFFIQLAGYNNFVDIQIVNLGWSLVRDVANMFLVVALLVIAFATILGLESYEMKKLMPKFILMAILVNFSKLIAGIIIDVAHVFTVTFLNAVSATAGGNLVNMFGLDNVLNMVSDPSDPTDLTDPGKIFLASAFAVTFAMTAFVSIFAYAVVLLYRTVILWVLIILSPLAYVTAILPKTKQIASEWWERFIKYVAVAPVMVFFMWLAFATMGASSDTFKTVMDGSEFQEENSTLSEASSWSNMAKFAIAVAFLFAGLERVQKMGLKGSQLVQSAQDFGKRVFTIASGVALGQAAYGKGKEIGGKAVGAAGEGLKAVTGINAAKDYAKIGAKKAKRGLRGTKVGQLLSSQQRKGKLKQEEKALEAQSARLKEEGKAAAPSATRAAVEEGMKRRDAEKEIELEKARAKGPGELRKQKRNHQMETARKQFGEERKDIEDKVGDIEPGNIEDAIIASIAGGNEGGKTMENVMNKMIEKVENTKWEGKNPTDPTEQMAKFLTAVTGENVGADSDSIGKAYNKIKGEMGEDFEASMENLQAGFKKSVSDGKVNMSGLVKDGDLQVEKDDDGKVTGVKESDIREHKLDYASRPSATEVVDLNDITGDSPDEEVNLKIDGKTLESSELDQQGVEQLLAFLKSTGSRSDFKGNVPDRLQDINNKEGDLMEAIMDDVKSTNKQAFENINDRIFGGKLGGEPSEETTGGGGEDSVILDSEGQPADTTERSSDQSETTDIEEETTTEINQDVDVDVQTEKQYNQKLNNANTISNRVQIAKQRKKVLQSELEDLQSELNQLQEESAPEEEIENISSSIEDLENKIDDVRDQQRNFEDLERGQENL